MISHKHKCIFIHIPRTGGTSVEQVVFGGNWWAKEKETKHLLASQAKEIYSDYWDDYFKFSFVRNPFDRVVSLLNFSAVYYRHSDTTKLTVEHLENYMKLYGFPVTVEYDYRFYQRSDVVTERHMKNQVYGNILDEELDFVGRFETLQDDFLEVCRLLGLPLKDLPKKAVSKMRDSYKSYYNDELIEMVTSLYQEDLNRFNYSFDGGSK